ncbi:MAG TPA: membrane protein insertase YidC, partial [Steroidobacteraceae bacterium]|nr:membrane protein insertase YidC [Steroidobacteraceae bacterium]
MTSNLPRYSPRLWLWVALAALLLVNYQTWIHDYAPPPEAATASQAANAAPRAAAPASDLESRIPAVPRAATPAPGERAGQREAGAPAPSGAPGTAPGSAAAAPRVRVRTDVLDLDVSTRGATLTRVDLLAYPQVKGEATPVRLENEDDPLTRYELQSGLTDSDGAPYPTHLASFASEQA